MTDYGTLIFYVQIQVINIHNVNQPDNMETGFVDMVMANIVFRFLDILLDTGHI